MKASVWERRTERAAQLASTHPAAAGLLAFYSIIASFQQRVYRRLSSGEESELAFLPELLDLVGRTGPPALAERSLQLMQRPDTWQALLGNEAQDAAEMFFTRAISQPFMEYRASHAGPHADEVRNTCPFCGSKPVVAVLRGEGDGGKRSLVCSLCSIEWIFRRILCPSCNEEDREKLPVISAAEFDHIRIEACDSCRTYIKCVDLTKDGLAVPIVDDIATIALDLWAEEHGYTKLQPNLLSM
jgi:FdhE protein